MEKLNSPTAILYEKRQREWLESGDEEDSIGEL